MATTTKKAPVENIETAIPAAATETVEKKAPKSTAKKTAEKKAPKSPAKKPAEKKTSDKKPADKKTAAKAPAAAKTAPKATKSADKKAPAKATKPADKKAPAKRGPKAKPITLDDVVALARIKANAANTTKVTKKIACTINVSGAVQGDFYIMLDAPDVISVEPYKYDDADISLWGTAEDIMAVMTNKIKLIDAVSSGKIGLWGNAEKAVIFVDAIF